MKREDCEYTSCYCEENVWKLCESVRSERTAPLEELFVVFISNDSRTVPLWKQKSGRGDQPDYHVVLLQLGPTSSSSVVYDLDSELPFPCSLELYATQALRSDRHINPAYHRKLRVVPADSFLSSFASDRSHMRNADGSWRMPPPPYPPIHTAECQMNLDDFISMSPSVGVGTVFSLEHFLQRQLEGSSP
ncbi:protein N-terminal glutamine amidohydrolase isoform X2 [Centropristis striata]|uniref:protein N-terminal glutamine amidohydrolase isoform X2 n=1 Tax=Centropristis striata TaxID=184440 RepID=UPI0027E1CAC3|nr:protein N-terminal glutamine amidohydrolase isoform X2 [Centropristis striata]